MESQVQRWPWDKVGCDMYFLQGVKTKAELGGEGQGEGEETMLAKQYDV